MAQVPKELIEAAKWVGVIPGAVCSCSCASTDIRTIPDYSKWSLDADGISVSFTSPNTGNWREFWIRSNAERWATVITPAPSKGLQEGDAVECGPAMRAAIIELAETLGLKNITAGGGNVVLFHANNTYEVSRTNGCVKNIIPTPEEFIARMRVTAGIPKPEMIDRHKVEYHDGYIKVGCTKVTNDVVRAIHGKLKD